MNLKIAILTGGISTEREIALASATSVANALVPHAMTKTFIFPEDREMFLTERSTFQCVIPIFHGRGGEDGVIQGFLETLEIPYTFSGVAAHAVAINKVTTNALVAKASWTVPPSMVMMERVPVRYDHPVVVKPVDGGSSIGVVIAKNQSDLDKAITEAFAVGSSVLVEDYIQGKEFSVAVAEIDGQTLPLPVIAIIPKNEFFDFQSKYEPGMADEICPADIPADLAKHLQDEALSIHQLIGARQVSRSDFIVDNQGRVWFLEINTIPGMSVLLPKALKALGQDFGEVLMSWVKQAIEK